MSDTPMYPLSGGNTGLNGCREPALGVSGVVRKNKIQRLEKTTQRLTDVKLFKRRFTESSENPIHHQFYAKMKQLVPTPNVLSQKTCYWHQNFSKYALYVIQVAFPISGEQPSFLPYLPTCSARRVVPWLSEARYRAPLLAAIGAVHGGYFQIPPSPCHLNGPQFPFYFF